MNNNSIKVEHSVELINITPINPLISKCQIKVCYVGDEPNRNKSIITKEVARQIANSLPGSPIVGYYNEEKEDFESHNRVIDISNGQFKLKDTTRPYGFVDLNARVWFEKYLENGVEREFLVTEGFLWTGQYPEARRIIQKGNNQSMELDDKIINAYWTKDNKGKPEFFIINEAIISKLCILGEDVTPCFEGASITKYELSLEDSFKQELFSMMEEIKNILNKGGTPAMNLYEQDGNEMIEQPTIEEESVQEEPVAEEEVPTTEPTEEPEIAEPAAEEPEVPAEEPAAEEEVPAEEPVAQYNLEEIPEYVDAINQLTELRSQYEALSATNLDLTAQVETLTEFKRDIEKREKESMIKSFYMLSDEDKKDVITNIDNYSLDEIESKLSVICVRNKVSFNLDTEEDNNNDVTTYNLNSSIEDSTIPAWLKAVQAVAEKM